jgi:hypothetical protein
MENLINTLKTRTEVEKYRAQMNEMCDKRNEFITLCEQANSLSEKSFGYIKEAFETLSPSLFNSSEGKKLINKYTKIVKEHKNLYSLHSLYENIRKAGKDMDIEFFVNNIANADWNVDSSTLKEDTYKLGRVLTEAYLFLGKDADSMLPKENKSLSMAVEYIAENKKTAKNIAEYSNAVKVIKENVASNKNSKNMFESVDLGETTENLLKEFNAKYADKLSAEEINILKEISSSQNKETIFNKYKEVCATKITEAKKSFEDKGDKASSDRLGVVLEQISNKSFSLDTVGSDICSLIELSNIFE